MEKVSKFIGFHKVKKRFYLVSSLLILLAGTLGFIYSAKAYSQLFHNDYVVEKNPIVSPSDDIVINFTQPILLGDEMDQVKVSPDQGVNLQWKNGGKQLVISPQDTWKMETEYSITLPEMKSIMFTTAPGREITFETMEYPKVAEFLPGENAQDVLLDIEDPLAVQFSNEMKDFDVKFMVDNAEAVSLASNESESAFGFLPKNVEDGRQYLAQVLVKPKGASENNFKSIYATSFKTSAPAVKKTETDFTQRLADARKSTTAKIKEGKYIDLNIATQVLSTFENGKLLDSYIVSSGKRGMDTPKGQFKVMAKKLRPWSSKYKLYMPFFMQFTGQGHGIHELPEWPGGYKEGANHLGIPVSHGCVRLGVGPAEQVYNWAESGTPIVVY
jgi:lipoprotein-anchoring transpeptidase ErfK/SrfK